MSRLFARFAQLAAIALCAMAPTHGVRAATISAKVNANVVKPLTFTAKQNMDFGTIALPALAVPLAVSVSSTGVRVCPAPLACTGIARQAIFNVTGSNAQVVKIIALPSDLINSSDGTRLSFVPTAPVSILLTNSGSPGRDFGVGGTITIPTNATGGLYTGDVEVTVEYQ